MQSTKTRSLSDRSFFATSKKTRAAAELTRVDMSSWRTPIPTRSICLHDDLESHVVTVQPPKPVLFLDDLCLPYADESLTTTPVDMPPSTSGRHVSISGRLDSTENIMTSFGSKSRGQRTPVSDIRPSLHTSGPYVANSSHSGRSTNVMTSFEIKSRDARTPVGDVTPLLSYSGYHISISGHLDSAENEVTLFNIRACRLALHIRDVTLPLSTFGRRISISGHSAWSVDDETSTETGSGVVATPTSDISPPRSSPVDDESRDRCESLTTITSRAPATAATHNDVVDSAPTAGPSVSVYRQSVVAETFRRCEPTHFHWTSTST